MIAKEAMIVKEATLIVVEAAIAAEEGRRNKTEGQLAGR